MAAPCIDLHTHSTASDGSTSPEDLMAEAAAAGLTTIALTDHDTTGGWDRAASALRGGLSLVRGVELSCAAQVPGDKPVSLHLLGYLFDPAEPEFAAWRRRLRDSRVGRAETMARALEAAGTGVTWERVRAIADGTVGRPHLAQAIVEQGHIATVGDAFTPDWIGTGGRFWAPKLEVDPVEGVRLIAAAGGVSVFAHPLAVKRGRTVPDSVIAQMAAAGLGGLEVDHVDHDDHARAHLRALAADLGLLTTGSSDFHGTRKTVQLAANTTSPDSLGQIVAGASGVPVLVG